MKANISRDRFFSKKNGLLMVILLILLLTGCHTVRETVNDIIEPELGDSDRRNLKKIEKQMLQEETVEVQIDRKISEAVKQMVATLSPRYKRYFLTKYRLGFLEISDIDRETVEKLHKYVTEKTLTFSYLQPVIAENFNIVERFLLKDVRKELEIEAYGASDEIIEQKMVRRLRRYGVDIIETGVVTQSYDFLDINLRMFETKRGRIIAVGSVKIEKTAPVRDWLFEMDGEYSDTYP